MPPPDDHFPQTCHESAFACPICGGPVIRGTRTVWCVGRSHGRPCTFGGAGQRVTAREFDAMIEGGTVELQDGPANGEGEG